jgi:hypothetical protein
MGRFAGKWVVIDPMKKTVIAVGETFKEIAPVVTHSSKAKVPPVGKAPFSFLVPRRDEGPYVLWIIKH